MKNYKQVIYQKSKWKQMNLTMCQDGDLITQRIISVDLKKWNLNMVYIYIYPKDKELQWNLKLVLKLYGFSNHIAGNQTGVKILKLLNI